MLPLPTAPNHCDAGEEPTPGMVSHRGVATGTGRVGGAVPEDDEQFGPSPRCRVWRQRAGSRSSVEMTQEDVSERAHDPRDQIRRREQQRRIPHTARDTAGADVRDQHQHRIGARPSEAPPQHTADGEREAHRDRSAVYARLTTRWILPVWRRIPRAALRCRRSAPPLVASGAWSSACPSAWMAARVAPHAARNSLSRSTRGAARINDVVARAPEELGIQPQRLFRSRSSRTLIVSRSGCGGRSGNQRHAMDSLLLWRAAHGGCACPT